MKWKEYVDGKSLRVSILRIGCGWYCLRLCVMVAFVIKYRIVARKPVGNVFTGKTKK
jgi:hypothetical protein